MTRVLKFLPTLVILAASLALAADEQKLRNPFLVTDVPNPDAEDVAAFAKDNKLSADAQDANAGLWSTMALAKKPDTIEGPWSGRWNGGPSNAKWTTGVATIRIADDRVFILYSDAGHYLIDAKRVGNKLIGRYVNINLPSDTSPWLGVIVDNTRIDGVWSSGRWDFQRQVGKPAMQKNIKLEIDDGGHMEINCMPEGALFPGC